MTAPRLALTPEDQVLLNIAVTDETLERVRAMMEAAELAWLDSELSE